MTDRDRIDDGTTAGIDDDRTEGGLEQTGGRLKEGAGKLFGDAKLKREGEADEAEDELQNAWGGVKDSVRDAVRGDDDDG